jgi:hypothetical protein
MPQIECPGKAVKLPYDRIDAAGFGPLPRWHRDRVRYAGTYDEKWEQARLPKGLLPEGWSGAIEYIRDKYIWGRCAER